MRIACLLLLVFGTVGSALEPCVSGVPVGKRPGPYSFLVASGPQRGQQTCYICETEDKPAAIVFARKPSDGLSQLLLKFDEYASRSENPIRSWGTILGEKTISLDELAKWSKSIGLKSLPLGVFDDADGPPSYKLNRDAEITVMLFVKRKVIANFAFREGELTEVKLKEIEKVLPKLLENQ